MEVGNVTEEIDFMEVLGKDYAEAMLKSKRVSWHARMKEQVLSFIDLIAAIASEALERKIYRNDVLETMVAFMIENPEILDKYLQRTFGIGIIPESEGEEPAFLVKLEITDDSPNLRAFPHIKALI